jgi:long-chain fatty acid transport protein
MRCLKISVATAILGLCASGIASAGGLYISEESAASNVAYGGVQFIARQTDASVVFSNPAGMTSFDKSELTAGGTLLYLHGPFSTDDDNTISGTSGRATEILALGNAQYIRPLNDKWTFGVHAGNYFGLLLNWGSGWAGRYEANQAIVIAPQIQPTLAYKISDAWSVGAGLGLTVGYLKYKASIPETALGNPDGKLRYSDTDFAVQPNLGVMFEPSENTRISLRYLVATDLDFRANPSIKRDNGNSIGGGDRDLGIGMTMPQQVMGGAWQRVSERWALLGNVGWEEWSEFGQVDIDISDSSIDETKDIKAEDTWHFGVGAEYQKTDKLMYTMGASWDSSWQRDKNRVPQIPIGSVYRIGGGFKYDKTDDFSWGAGFSIFYEGDVPVEPSTNSQGTFSGEYSSVALYWLSLYASWR